MSASVDAPLQLAELCRLVEAAEPAALLVPPRLLRRAIKYDRKLTMIGLHIPHRKSYVIGREALLGLTDREELGVGPERALPETVLLLARPDAEELADSGRGQVLVETWRLLFHARVHLAIARRFAEHRLTRAVIRARIQRIGRTEFEEIRTVLRQGNYLLPPRDAPAAYEEFAAFYLELRFFSNPPLPPPLP